MLHMHYIYNLQLGLPPLPVLADVPTSAPQPTIALLEWQLCCILNYQTFLCLTETFHCQLFTVHFKIATGIRFFNLRKLGVQDSHKLTKCLPLPIPSAPWSSCQSPTLQSARGGNPTSCLTHLTFTLRFPLCCFRSFPYKKKHCWSVIWKMRTIPLAFPTWTTSRRTINYTHYWQLVTGLAAVAANPQYSHNILELSKHNSGVLTHKLRSSSTIIYV